MNSRQHLPAIALVACLLAVPTAAHAQWTRFRGPNGTGVSSATNLPAEFGPEKAVVWKTAVPPGHSSPVLTPTRIFLTAHTTEKDAYKLLVICLDRKSGRLLWQREVPRAQKGRLQGPNGPASPSPVTDGSNVYVLFQEFGLLAFDADGNEKWRLPLGPFNMFYGFGASPVLVDDLVAELLEHLDRASVLRIEGEDVLERARRRVAVERVHVEARDREHDGGLRDTAGPASPPNISS